MRRLTLAEFQSAVNAKCKEHDARLALTKQLVNERLYMRDHNPKHSYEDAPAPAATTSETAAAPSSRRTQKSKKAGKGRTLKREAQPTVNANSRSVSPAVRTKNSPAHGRSTLRATKKFDVPAPRSATPSPTREEPQLHTLTSRLSVKLAEAPSVGEDLV
jgi:hypothetical protein